MYDQNLLEKAHKIAEHLNSKGYNIQNVGGIKKGTGLFFNKSKNDMISLTHYFVEVPSPWESGIQLHFTYINGVLKYKGKGAFSYRNDKYKTPENDKIIQDIAGMVETLVL